MIRSVFWVVAILGLAAALATVLARNLVRAGLWLVAFFFCVACMFILLEAELLAALQVLIYIGAVSILLMFGIMLTRGVQGMDQAPGFAVWRLPGIAAGLVVFVVLAYGIMSARGLIGQRSWATNEERPAIPRGIDPQGPPRQRAINNMGKELGDELMGRYVIGFELAGLLLTAALVGAVAVAHGEDDPRRTGPRTMPAEPETAVLTSG